MCLGKDKYLFTLITIFILSKTSFGQIVENTRVASVYKSWSFSPVETLLSLNHPIDTVVFIGKFNIKHFILRRISLLAKGDTLTKAKMQNAFERLFNLQLFNVVLVSAKRFNSNESYQEFLLRSKSKEFRSLVRTFQNKSILLNRPFNVVVISLEERLNTTILPRLKILGTNFSKWIANPTWDNLNLGITSRYNNLSGFTDVLGFDFGGGFSPFFKLYYFHPYIFPDLNIGGGGTLLFSLQNNLSLSPDGLSQISYQNNIGYGQLFLNYVLANDNTFYISLTVSYLDVPSRIKSQIPLSILSNDNQTIFTTFSISYQHQNVDFIQYPMQGVQLYGRFSQYGFPWTDQDDGLNLTKLTIDARFYKKIFENLAVSVRHSSSISLFDKPSPNYLRTFFGYNLNIRGYTYQVLEGDNFIFHSTELRYAIFPVKTFNFDFIPLERFKRLQLGMFITFFFDAGNIWYNLATYNKAGVGQLSNNQSTFDYSKWRYGYGTGVSIVLGYNITLRFDFAFNNQKQFEFSFTNRVSF